MMHEVFENPVLGWRQIDGFPPSVYGLLSEAQDETAHAQHRVFHSLSSADQGTCTGDEFSKIKGLGHVVIRTQVQQIDRALLLRNGGKYQNRSCSITIS